MADRAIYLPQHHLLAALKGGLSQYREPLKTQPFSKGATPLGVFGITSCFCFKTPEGTEQINIPIAVGDRLWVKEGFARAWETDGDGTPVTAEQTYYRADGEPFDEYEMPDGSIRDGIPWRSPIHMPRWASRLTLTVTDVRVQQVQEISEADAKAEGADPEWHEASKAAGIGIPRFRHGFRTLWNSIHGPDAWDRNPFVAAYTFTVDPRNIDARQQALNDLADMGQECDATPHRAEKE
jgi:hypothetical protein